MHDTPSCSVENCARPVRAHGLCITHYERERHAQAAPCIFDGCMRRSAVAGLCAMHYKRRKKGKDMAAAPRQIAEGLICSFPDCTKPAWAKGLCGTHYSRLRKQGDPAIVQTTGHIATPLLDRFWSRVDKSGPIPAHRPDLGPCWLWTGKPETPGYGVIYAGGRNSKATKAHRFSWELVNGPIPEGQKVCHRCDVRMCVRPTHLFLGTAQENTADMVHKGRQARGERAGLARLRADDVRAIRRLHATGKVSQTALATGFDISTGAVRAILTGRSWKHLP